MPDARPLSFVQRTGITSDSANFARLSKPTDTREACKTCHGTGQASKYDLGWNSLCHLPEFAVKGPCPMCGATGKRNSFPNNPA